MSGDGPDPDLSLEQRIHAEKIKALASNIPLSILFSGLAAVLAVWGTHAQVGGWIWTWLAAYLLSLPLRYWWLTRYLRSDSQERAARRWGYSLSLNLACAGLLWMLFGIGTFRPDESIHALFVAFILAGLVSVSSATFGAYTPAMMSFSLPLMVGFALPYALAGRPTYLLLAVMAGLYGGVVILASRTAERLLTQSIRLRFENQRLIKELTDSSIQAQAGSRAKSDFLAMMSHEIRTPMNGVAAMTELLLQTALDQEQRSMASIINRSADGLLTIINDVLDFSKIEAGRLLLETVEFAVSEVVEDVAQVMAPRAGEKRLDLIVDIAIDGPASLEGDPARLRQILLNLVGNAVKFTESGHVRIIVERQPQLLRFTVADTGPGIAAEVQKTLFSPFVQGSAAVARRHGGTGLGLSISKRLVELMGGRIWVESALGGGARFIFDLPCTLRPARSTSKPLAGIRLHVAAAQPLRDSLQHMLTGQGAEITDRPQEAMVLVHDGPAPDHPAAIALIDFDQHPPDDGSGSAVRKPVRCRDLVTAIQQRLGRGGAAAKVKAGRAFAAPEREAAEAKKCVILVAEDNVTNLAVLSKLLDRLGMVYDLCEDGAEALQRFSQHGFYGLVLTDFHMPRMNGVALARAIRALPDNDTPILALTADALPETAELCRTAGMQGHMTKPLRLAILQESLERWLPTAIALRRELG